MINFWLFAIKAVLNDQNTGKHGVQQLLYIARIKTATQGGASAVSESTHHNSMTSKDTRSVPCLAQKFGIPSWKLSKQLGPPHQHQVHVKAQRG
ncbi:MAG: hypothetical protein ACPG3T_06295, partial [Pseudomonadales bacterium]